MASKTIQFEDWVIDTATGFEGMVIGKATYFYKDSEFLVAAQTKNANEDLRWLAQNRLKIKSKPSSTGFSNE